MKRHVLIVEGNDIFALALRRGFEYDGYEVTVAADGAEGLRRALEDAPDLVLLDAALPVLDGTEVCRRIRDSGVDTPVLLLTATASEEDIGLATACGADDSMTRFTGFLELLDRAEAALHRFGYPRRATPRRLRPD